MFQDANHRVYDLKKVWSETGEFQDALGRRYALVKVWK